jgi:hypothetical protein
MKLIARQNHLKLFELESPVDLSEQNNGKKTTINYEVQGHEVDIAVIFEEENPKEQSVSLGYFVGDTGLIVNLADEKIFEETINFIMSALANQNNQ